MLSWFDALLLGIVEGVTEYLPVSSTGHLILASALLGLPNNDAIKSFEIVIQLGAILAVIGLYQPRVVQMLRGVTSGDAEGRRLLGLLVIGCLPAGLLGLLLRGTVKDHLFYPVPVAAALAVGGVAIFAFEPLRKRRASAGAGIDSLNWRSALIVGLCQCFALWPGTSRSLTTILGGLAVGLTPVAAAEFSFLLALPILSAAALLDIATEGRHLIETIGPGPLLVGFLSSTVTAALAVKGLVAWLNRHGLWPFGIYRLLVAGAVYSFWTTP